MPTDDHQRLNEVYEFINVEGMLNHGRIRVNLTASLVSQLRRSGCWEGSA
jgi:hypothetical protein